MKKIIYLLEACFVLGVASFSWAEVAVIVHPSAGFDSLTGEDVSRLFLGKSKNFPDGAQAVPVNQDEGSAARDKFNQVICNKNASQYKTYWSGLVFTGKGTPPSDAGDDSTVRALISANPNMIGYIDASAVDVTVKVVYKMP
ncbi:MAG: phosphate ABC transporter substrate-binding protein [Cellvibrio sp.]|uniref:phosphate ABC transporter substrate-binding protein n=1 Tax=Cellvibrio sp. TaxID=1965322 RepID=UPI00272887A0|nr:phosphate ABC transporter substrate-binding protein [Cellvibrio sp.]